MALSNASVSSSISAAYGDDNVNYELDYELEDYYHDYGDGYAYPIFSFETPVYLYIWEIIVIFVFLVNVIVIMVLLSKKMRNATNMILAAIAISDSLTGLVTLPTYIMVYISFDPIAENNGDTRNDMYNYIYQLLENYVDSVNHTEYDDIIYHDIGNNKTYEYEYNEYRMAEDGYTLTRNLCNWFMISRYFFSKSFHTISIFLTLFLCIQRYVSVAYPFKYKSLFRKKIILIWCGIIFVMSPIIHSYHIDRNKIVLGICRWEDEEDHCESGCINLWVSFFLCHLIPCVTLIVFTCLFIWHLHIGERNRRRMNRTTSKLLRQLVENRRISIIVTAVVIVFLVPEIPYGIFLLYNAMQKTMHNETRIKLETNRAIHMSYELLLVMSFHANFYIYTFLNRRFRSCLYKTFIKPVREYVRYARRSSVVSISSSNSSKPSTRRTEISSKNGQELTFIRKMSSGKSGTLDTNFLESSSRSTNQSSRRDGHGLPKLNTNA